MQLRHKLEIIAGSPKSYNRDANYDVSRKVSFSGDSKKAPQRKEVTYK